MSIIQFRPRRNWGVPPREQSPTSAPNATVVSISTACNSSRAQKSGHSADFRPVLLCGDDAQTRVAPLIFELLYRQQSATRPMSALGH